MTFLFRFLSCLLMTSCIGWLYPSDKAFAFQFSNGTANFLLQTGLKAPIPTYSSDEFLKSVAQAYEALNPILAKRLIFFDEEGGEEVARIDQKQCRKYIRSEQNKGKPVEETKKQIISELKSLEILLQSFLVKFGRIPFQILAPGDVTIIFDEGHDAELTEFSEQFRDLPIPSTLDEYFFFLDIIEKVVSGEDRITQEIQAYSGY